ncbi:lipase [Marmoricola endophyticus]|uniref:Lipase n=1 Tax=Marmoricola endophyticus TaxID=2040280 RepID=A0A917BD31_9ACTN|nr:alpha/beta fold hydrolase [Marmoricola endophyticus]GGF37638.1 lipase [Marmoricola endophyticus]
MLDSLAPARRRLVLALLGALVVVVVAGAVVLVVRSTGSGPSQDDPGPVVLVPGYGGDAGDLEPLTDRARALGRAAYPFDPPGDGTGDLRTEARALARFVDRVLARTGAESVDLVGYSAGGIVARVFIRYDGGDALVRRVLTVGSPHHGTEVAQQAKDAAGGCPAGCEALATDSSLIRRLDAGDETPDQQRWVTVRSDADRTVVPTDTAELEGALNLRIQTYCPDRSTDHGNLPRDPVSLAALDATIGKAAPSRPGRVDCG